MYIIKSQLPLVILKIYVKFFKKYFTFMKEMFLTILNHGQISRNLQSLSLSLIYGKYDWSKIKEREKTMTSIHLKL